MVIREYQNEDRESVVQCILELQNLEVSHRPNYWANPESIKDEYLDHLLSQIKEQGGKLFVAEVDQKVVGFVVVRIDTEESPCVDKKKVAYIPDLSVMGDYRNKGIGAELLKKAEGFAVGEGFSDIYLDVSVGNQAISLYKRSGYSEQSIKMGKKLGN
ncbi:MAG: GNAT family N-acetyltransferase [Candidatus Pacebacteria bacterium]|nr:GNAT family N-acetyltransferase [Candidatus Paceibacterota bacterium]